MSDYTLTRVKLLILAASRTDLFKQSCSWCDTLNAAPVDFCEGCGHCAHRPRVNCYCPRCESRRRRARPAAKRPPNRTGDDNEMPF